MEQNTQLKPIPAVKTAGGAGNTKISLITIVLFGILGFIALAFLLPNSSNGLSLVHQEYRDSFVSNDVDTGVGYRIGLFSVRYFENCSSPFTLWCKHDVEGVSPREFIPLNRHTAKVISDNSKTAVIYNGYTPIPTSVVTNPMQFRALSELSTNPVYFTDDEYIYYLGSHCCAEIYSWIGTDNKSNINFPIKISPGDKYEVPSELEQKAEWPYSRDRVLFLNENVYVNGKLLPSANSATYKKRIYDEELETFIILD